MKRILFSPEPAEGNGNNPPAQDPPPAQPAPEPIPTPGDPPTPPPAAATVLKGERSERELKLEEDLRKATERAEKAEGTVKERETKVAELEDQLSTLNSPAAPAPDEGRPRRMRRYKL